MICDNCVYGGLVDNHIICLFRRSENFGDVIFQGKIECNNFRKRKDEIRNLRISYLWCDTCKTTVFPDDIELHKNHKLHMDVDMEYISKFSEIILYGGD